MKEESKNIFFVSGAIILAGLIFFASQSFSYDTEVAHPFLTEKAVALYEKSTGEKLSYQEKDWIRQGAVDEDTPHRWMNHFYDPNIGIGLPGFTPANIWANSSLAQSTYLMGDQSWGTAISAYNNNDKKRAFTALGHVLHLMEDMAVPAHTRNDTHVEGDPYENWVKANTNKKYNQVSLIKLDNLNQSFNSLANYSNKYFLSKSTITPRDFINKNLVERESGGVSYECIEGVVENNKICLTIYKKSKFGKEEYVLDLSEKISVHSDYYSLLAPKAISYGAGVIDLFFRQAKAESDKKPTPLVKLKNTFSYLSGVLISGFTNFFGAYEETVINYSKTLSNNNTSAGVGRVLSEFEQAGSAEEIFTPKPTQASQTDNPPSAKATAPTPPLQRAQAAVNSPKPVENPVVETPITKAAPEPAAPAASLPPPPEKVEQPAQAAQTAPTFIFVAGDSLPPETTIASGPSQLTNLSSADFTFTANEANSTFEGNLDDADWQACGSPHNLNNLADGNHVFKVRAIDPLNNVDQTPSEYSWTIDTIAPQVTIISGPPDVASSTTASFQFSSSESETAYQCRLDSNPWEMCSASTSAYSLIEGNHSLEVKGTDPAGNTGSSTIKIWLVDLTAPASVVDSLPATTTALSFAVSWNGQDADATGSTTLASGIENYDVQYKIDAGAWQSWVNATTSTSTIFNIAVADGQTVYFRSRARDYAGNLENWPADANGDTNIAIIASASNIITAGNTSAAYNDWHSSFNWKHTVSGDDPVLIVAFHADRQFVDSVSYNGQSMLLAAQKDYSQPFNNIAVAVYYLANPSPGENDIQVSLNSSDAVAASAITFNNCDTANPVGLADTFLDTITPISHSVTTANDGMMLVDAVTYNKPSVISVAPKAGQTQYFNQESSGQWFSWTTSDLYAGESYKSVESAGSKTMGWITGDSRTSVHAIVGLNPKP